MQTINKIKTMDPEKKRHLRWCVDILDTCEGNIELLSEEDLNQLNTYIERYDIKDYGQLMWFDIWCMTTDKIEARQAPPSA